MKIDIIIAYLKRYEYGHEKDFVPPITGIHLAALTPQEHKVRVFHQQVDAIDYDTDADIIAISFFSGFAPAAFKLASVFMNGFYMVKRMRKNYPVNMNTQKIHLPQTERLEDLVSSKER